jgi:hypothetical protein
MEFIGTAPLLAWMKAEMEEPISTTADRKQPGGTSRKPAIARMFFNSGCLADDFANQVFHCHL